MKRIFGTDRGFTLIEVLLAFFIFSILFVTIYTSYSGTFETINLTENRMELITSSPEVGESQESVPIKYSGKDITIAFNPAFLMAPLKHLDSDEIYLELSDELSTGVIKTNVPFLYVIMPIRVN